MSSSVPNDLANEDATGSNVTAPEDPLATEDAPRKPLKVANQEQEVASPESPGGWGLDPVTQLASTHESYEGEGWGVPPPPSYKKPALVSSLESRQGSNGGPSPSSSSSANGTTSSIPRAPPVPIGQFTTSAWPILRTQPVFPPSRPPPPPEPTRSYPESHNRQPTYIHAPSPAPSLTSSQAPSSTPQTRASASTPLTTGSRAFRPLLQAVTSFAPSEPRPLRTKCALALIKAEGGDAKTFYRQSGHQDWKSYALAAQAKGLVELGVGALGSGYEWIAMTDVGRQALRDGSRAPVPEPPAQPPPPSDPSMGPRPQSSLFQPLLSTIAASPPSRPRPLQSRCEISLLKRHAPAGDAAAFWAKIGHRDFKTYVYAAEVAGWVQTGFAAEGEHAPWLGNEWIGLTDLGRRELAGQGGPAPAV